MVCYKCIYCQQKFIYKGNYTSHNKNIDKCKNKFEEQIAKYKKYTNEKLLYDYNNLVIDDLRHKCKFCDKNYNSYNGLKRHLLKTCPVKLKKNLCIAITKEKVCIKKQKIKLKNKLNNQNKYKKKPIPHALKRAVWNYWIGEIIGATKCLCCKTTTISQMNFHCGHIVAEAKGGKNEITNLKPICQPCNSSMKTENMNEFIESCGFAIL